MARTIDGSTLRGALKSDGHTMAYVMAQNAKLQLGELDVVAKTPGGGISLFTKDMKPMERGYLYFNKAAIDLIEQKYLDKRWVVDEIFIGKKKYLALKESDKGFYFGKHKIDGLVSGYDYRVRLGKSATSLAREILSSKTHPRSPKFTLWEVSDELTGGVTTLILRPSERMVI